MKKIAAIAIVALIAVSCGEAPSAEEPATVEVDTTAAKLAPVYTQKVEKGPFEHKISVQGNVMADQNVILYAQSGGNVRSINVKEGQTVSKGQTLVSFDTDVLSQQIQATETQLELATFTYERQNNLWKQNIGSELQMQQAKTQKESLEAQIKTLKEQRAMGVVTAPFSGVVDQIMPKQGEMVGPGMPVLRLLNLDRAYVEADIPEYYHGKVEVGDPVSLEFGGMEHLNMDSLELSMVGKYVNPSNRTIRVKVEFNNVKGLVPNLLANMMIRDYANPDAVKVPSTYIRQDVAGNDYVLVVEQKDGKDIVVLKEVTVGMSYQPSNDAVSMTEIKSGLEGGEVLITKGYKRVSPGDEVEVKNN